MRVLIAEDDPAIAADLSTALSSAGFLVDIETDGEAAQVRGETEHFNAVILDLGLPTIDGLTILRRWRKGSVTAPVLILTARHEWHERVEGIEAGADDYVVKPFRVEEVVARVRALVRRAAGVASPEIQFAEYTLNPRMLQVTRDGVPVHLTPQEYKLLAYLVMNRGRVVSALEITEHLYSQEMDRDSNSIEVLVRRVRKRVGDHLIQTRRGFGYYIEDAR